MVMTSLWVRASSLAMTSCPTERERLVTTPQQCPERAEQTEGGVIVCFISHYSTVQYSTVQYSTVQYSTVQYSIVKFCPTCRMAAMLPHLQQQLGAEKMVTGRSFKVEKIQNDRKFPFNIKRIRNLSLFPFIRGERRVRVQNGDLHSIFIFSTLTASLGDGGVSSCSPPSASGELY